MPPEVLALLERAVVALETMAEFERRHFEVYSADSKKADARHKLAERRYQADKKLRDEYLARQRKMAAAVERADDRQAFAQELSLSRLGLRVPDTVPPDLDGDAS
jgi:hypothetical protein